MIPHSSPPNAQSPMDARHASTDRAPRAWTSWLRPVAKAAATIGVVAGLTWMGASASASKPVLPANSTGGAMVAVAASTPSASASATKDSPPPDTKASRGVLADGRVVLNVADEHELCQLPRVGPSKAKRIIALREKLGKFRSPRDLLRVKGIGARTLQQMMPKLVVDDPEGGTKAGS